MEKRDFGLVSIIMPNYNGAKYLTDTINSVLAQTYTNWELVFVDDCSKDDSIELIKSFGDKRIRVLKNEVNSGAAVTRNYALREARGRWMAFLDSDDIWESEKLERQISFMVENNYAFTLTDYEVIDDTNKTVSHFVPSKDVFTYRDILKHNQIGCLTVIYDTDKLGRVFMPTNAERREDFACWLSILRSGTDAYCLHECLSKYKVHSNSVSSNKFKMIKYQWRVYKRVEGLSFLKACYYMASWALTGLFKYKK